MYSVFVHTKEQYDEVKNYPFEMIYTDNKDLLKEDATLYYEVPNYPHEKNLPPNIYIQDLGCLYKYKDKNIVTGTNLNIANSLSIESLMRFKVKKITLSLECSLEELKFLKKASSYPLEAVLYHRPLVMTLKRHPLIKSSHYELEDYEHKHYKILVRENGEVLIYHYEVINHLALQKDYETLGISHFQIRFVFENKEEVLGVLENLFKTDHPCHL